jgi:hypothetical protein
MSGAPSGDRRTTAKHLFLCDLARGAGEIAGVLPAFDCTELGVAAGQTIPLLWTFWTVGADDLKHARGARIC